MTTSIAATLPQPASHRSDDPAGLKAAAQEFEALFLAQVLRGLTASLEGAGPLGRGESDPFRDMLADAYARLVARAGGIGIADAVMRELVRAQEVS